MNIPSLCCYSFLIALVIVCLVLIFKRLKNINNKLEEFNNTMDKNNVYDSLIDNDGKYPIKIINPGENDKYDHQQEKILIEPQFMNKNNIIDAAFDVLPNSDENPFKTDYDYLKNDENKDKNKIKDSYFYDLGEIDGSLRNVKSHYICGKKQWPVGFDLKIDKEIADNVKNDVYSRTSPYTSGMSSMSYGKDGQKDYGFACIDKKIDNWYYCRGGNACDSKKVNIQ